MLHRVVLIALTLVLTVPALGAGAPAPQNNRGAARNSPAFEQIRELRQTMRALGEPGADRASLVATADRLMSEIRRKDPSFDLSRFETDLAPYRQPVPQPQATTRPVSTAAPAKRFSSMDEADAFIDKMYGLAGDFPSPTNQNLYLERGDVTNYLERARSLDWPNTRPAVEDAVRRFPRLADDYEAKGLLRDFEKDFRGTSEAFLKAANKFIEESYRTKSRNKLEAVEQAEMAVDLTHIVLAVFPDHARALELERDAKAALGEMGGALASTTSGASSFHAEHMGEIVFFRRPVKVRSEDASTIATSFAASEPIYAAAYFKGALKDLFDVPNRDNLRGVFKFEIAIDGNRVDTFDGFPIALTWDEYKDPSRTFLTADVAPDPTQIEYPTAREYDLGVAITKLLAESLPRRHTVEVKVLGGYNPIATGSFEIDLSSGREQLAARSAALYQEKISKVFLPAAKMSNAALQSSMAQALAGNGWKQQILRVVITDSAWTIHRNAFGAIEFRSIGTAAAVKEPDGRCRYFEISFKQAYRGGGYGRTEQYGVGNNYDMACENVRR